MRSIIARWRPRTAGRRWTRSCATSATRGVNMAFPSAISTGVMRSPVGNISVPEAKGTQDYFGLNYYSTRHGLL